MNAKSEHLFENKGNASEACVEKIKRTCKERVQKPIKRKEEEKGRSPMWLVTGVEGVRTVIAPATP